MCDLLQTLCNAGGSMWGHSTGVHPREDSTGQGVLPPPTAAWPGPNIACYVWTTFYGLVEPQP